MKSFLVKFCFEMGKIKLADSLTVFAPTQPEAIAIFNTIIASNQYIKIAHNDGFAVVDTKVAKLKMGIVKEV